MKLLYPLLLSLAFCSCNAQQLNTVNIKSMAELQEYFRYSP